MMRSRVRLRLVALTTVVMAGTGTRPAQAQDAVDRRSLYREGEILMEEGHFNAALATFERLYHMAEGTPSRYRYLKSIGTAYEALGRFDQAVRYYDLYMQEATEEQRRSFQAHVDLVRRRLGRLIVRTAVPSVGVLIDGLPFGPAPGPFVVSAGSHTIEVREPSYLSDPVEVVVLAEETTPVTLTLRPRRPLSPAFFWTGVGLSAATLGVGAGFGIDALYCHDQYTRLLRSPSASSRLSVGPDDLAHVAESARRADILYAVGGGLAAVTAIVGLVLTDFRPASPARPFTWLRPAFGADLRGLVWEGVL
ncbi:MAG: PEGA domain-containing protein [Myxococcaceae bacterium]|nr:MAG: PEGA domain-containing protein [Myxococcaceae bacterium]